MRLSKREREVIRLALAVVLAGGAQDAMEGLSEAERQALLLAAETALTKLSLPPTAAVPTCIGTNT